jgi:hypothetical protein
MPRGADAQRKFKAGRTSKFREERMSEDRRAWLKTFVGQFILKISPREEDDPSEYGDSVWLVIPRPNSRPVMLNLTALTHEELKLTRQFFNAVFDIAEPLCMDRDKVAQDAFDQGDDSHIRLYRSVPELIVRKGTVGAHGQVLRERLANVASGPEQHVDPSRAFRDDSDDVATEAPADDRPEDDEPASD